MSVGKLAIVLFVLALLPRAFAQDSPAKNDVHWCSAIPSFPVLQEAQFTAVYVFDLDANGQPANIRRVHVPFISKADSALIACIAEWRLPNSKGKGAAIFSFKWGWTGLEVSSGDFKMTIPAQSASAKSN